MNSDGRHNAPHPPTRLVARFVPRARRRHLNAALAAGRAQRIAAVDLLAPEALNALASYSLVLLLAGAVVFGGLEAAAWRAHHARLVPEHLGLGGQIALLVVGNIAAYVIVILLHEAVHAGVIVALGGRPRFGLSLPMALYCTAPGQAFTRGGYTAVALGPLIVISLAGMVAIWLAPHVGAYLLLALAGNVAGAVGDLVAAVGMRAIPTGALIADWATGYEVYSVEAL